MACILQARCYRFATLPSRRPIRAQGSTFKKSLNIYGPSRLDTADLWRSLRRSVLTAKKRSATFPVIAMGILERSLASLLVFLYCLGFPGSFTDGREPQPFVFQARKNLGTDYSNWLTADFDGDQVSDLAVKRSDASSIRVDIRL